MNEQMPDSSQERRNHTPEGAYDEAVHAPDIMAHCKEEVRGLLRDLQLEGDGLIFPLNDSQLDATVSCLQMALDRGQCHDTPEAKKEWMRRQMYLLKPKPRSVH